MSLAWIIKNKFWIMAVVILLLIAALSVSIDLVKRQKNIANRWQNNYQSDLKRYKDKIGADAVRVQELQLTISDIKRSTDSTIIALYNNVRNLGKRNNELEQLLSVKTLIVYDSIFVPIVDTVIIVHKDTIRRLATYRSKWLDATISVEQDKLKVINYESRDEIIISLGWYKDRRCFIGRWFERKKWAADIKSLNPYSRIEQATNIKITGRQGR